ncbi:MAG: hypothetical protein NXI15_05500 [Gammaproteobacteria bacterium]|nr:hypothetical protein [Gammaproteobacteria bacterium]
MSKPDKRKPPISYKFSIDDGTDVQLSPHEYRQERMKEAVRMARSDDARYRRHGELLLAKLTGASDEAHTVDLRRKLNSIEKRKKQRDEIALAVREKYSELITAGKAPRETTTLIVQHLESKNTPRGRDFILEVLREAGLRD